MWVPLMSVELAIIGILGFAQGFVFIPWVIGLIGPIVKNVLPLEPHWLPKLIGRICVFVCLLMTYFGLGLLWMRTLGSVSGTNSNEQFKVWIGASLIGMFVYLGIAKMRTTKGTQESQ
jgi:hypothetical protein